MIKQKLYVINIILKHKKSKNTLAKGNTRKTEMLMYHDNESEDAAWTKVCYQ